MLARRRRPAWSAGAARPRRGRWILIAAALAAGCGAAAARGTGTDRVVLAAAQRFALFYSGVFALIALTAAVAAGLVAADRIVMTPAGRVSSQAVHRALSLAAVGFLAISRADGGTGASLAPGRRGRAFPGERPDALPRPRHARLRPGAGDPRHRRRPAQVRRDWTATWRVMHVTAYLAWPLAILHGLLAGRHAKPYVDWSYGACLAAVALALVIRLVATTRSRTERGPVPGARACRALARVRSRGQSCPSPRARASPCPPTRRTGRPRRGDGIRRGAQPRLCHYVGHHARGSLHRAAAPDRRP